MHKKECEKTLRDGLNAHGVAVLTQETVRGCVLMHWRARLVVQENAMESETILLRAEKESMDRFFTDWCGLRLGGASPPTCVHRVNVHEAGQHARRCGTI